MRDPKRIPKILKRLQKVWEKYPDLRLGQLIENVFPKVPGGTVRQAYFLEDEEFISTLEAFYSEERIFRVGGKEDLAVLMKELKRRD